MEVGTAPVFVLPTPAIAIQVIDRAVTLMDALARGGFHQMVINTAWLGEQIPAYFSDKNGVKPIWDKRKKLSMEECWWL